ncbi:MAG: hypothetical protein SVV80_09145 [Planctomycetota bacterium]|nr:hypothetical protein [Planctomycetota bacterium]
MATRHFSAAIYRENLREAVELFLESVGESEIAERLHGDVCQTGLEVSVG